MSDLEPALGIVVTHGALCTGLVDAVAKIAGIEDALVPISNEGLAPDALAKEVEEAIGMHRGIIFTDMPSGSCAMSGMMCAKGRDKRALIFGVNLPILLDFVFHREIPLAELTERLVQRGRESVRARNPGEV